MQHIEDLDEMSKEELSLLWRKLLPEVAAPRRSDRMIRELAYRWQEKVNGRLDKATTVSLRRHMMTFEASLKRGADQPVVKTPARLKLEKGSVISRKWNDRSISVKVIGPREFEFEGRRYKSLSKISREITGQHLSGPMFFGLKEVNRG